MPKQQKTRNWLSSTMIVLILALLLFVCLAYFWHGSWKLVLEQVINYGVGATVVALVVAIIGLIFKKPIGNLVKQIMR